jgi:hypothetical protein
MRLFQRVASAIVLDRDGIALSQTPGAAGPLTLNGAGVVNGAAVLDPARAVAVYSGGNISSRVFTITGEDRNGNLITDTVTGVNATTVSSSQLFSKVTGITIDALSASAVEVGWTAVSYTSWITLGDFVGDYDWTLRVFFAAGGTVSYDIEATMQNMNRDQCTGDETDDVITLASAQTGNYLSFNEAPVAAVRIKVTAQDVPVTLRVLPSRTA